MYNQNVQLWRLAKTAELSVIEIGSVDDWQDHPDCPHRVVFGQDRVVQCRDGDEVAVSTSCIQFSDGSIDSAAVAEIADNRAVIDQAKGMLILLYGVDDESAFRHAEAAISEHERQTASTGRAAGV